MSQTSIKALRTKVIFKQDEFDVTANFITKRRIDVSLLSQNSAVSNVSDYDFEDGVIRYEATKKDSVSISEFTTAVSQFLITKVSKLKRFD